MAHKVTDRDKVIRRLYPADHEAICSHFRRLDAVSRRARFFGSISDDGIHEYARNIFRHGSILCGAFLDGELRGIVELRGVLQFLPSRPEAAFSVEAEWQNIGIGDALLDRIIAVARNRGVRSIKLMCLRDNSRMRHLAAKHSAELDVDQDVAESTLRLQWPTPTSLAEEVIGEARAYTHFLIA